MRTWYSGGRDTFIVLSESMTQVLKFVFCVVFTIRRMIIMVCANTQIGFLSLYEIKLTLILSSSLYHLFRVLPTPETRNSDFWFLRGLRSPLGVGPLGGSTPSIIGDLRPTGPQSIVRLIDWACKDNGVYPPVWGLSPIPLGVCLYPCG